MGLAEHHVAFGGSFTVSLKTWHALLRDAEQFIERLDVPSLRGPAEARVERVETKGCAGARLNVARTTSTHLRLALQCLPGWYGAQPGVLREALTQNDLVSGDQITPLLSASGATLRCRRTARCYHSLAAIAQDVARARGLKTAAARA
jgi:hypothetical protein